MDSPLNRSYRIDPMSISDMVFIGSSHDRRSVLWRNLSQAVPFSRYNRQCFKMRLSCQAINQLYQNCGSEILGIQFLYTNVFLAVVGLECWCIFAYLTAHIGLADWSMHVAGSVSSLHLGIQNDSSPFEETSHLWLAHIPSFSNVRTIWIHLHRLAEMRFHNHLFLIFLIFLK